MASYDEIMSGAKAEAAKPRIFAEPKPAAPAYKKAAPPRPAPSYKPGTPKTTLGARLQAEQQLEGGRGQGIFRARTYGTTK